MKWEDLTFFKRADGRLVVVQSQRAWYTCWTCEHSAQDGSRFGYHNFETWYHLKPNMALCCCDTQASWARQLRVRAMRWVVELLHVLVICRRARRR
eukprot:SAG11_NODE_661_length_7885_cov_8.956974_6_plen_96_part_00